MRTLPHKPPLLYAREVLESSPKECLVRVCFGENLPTLGMVIEASAQAFVFLDIPSEAKMGMLVMAKEVAWENPEARETALIVRISLQQIISMFYHFSFEARSSSRQVVARGQLSVLLGDFKKEG